MSMRERRAVDGILATDGVRKSVAGETLTRFVKVAGCKPTKPRQGTIPSLGHPTIEAGRSLFYRKGVKPVEALPHVLVSGHNNIKIGRDVRKGHLRGYWIYTLSLEERATCPRSCQHWYSCYGNNMPFARRVDHRNGVALEAAIEADLDRLLSVRGRAGVLLRLHALGDFFSVEYVAFWDRMLRKHPRLAIFGYTARNNEDEVGEAVLRMRTKWLKSRRFMIRSSNGARHDMATRSIHKVEDCPSDAFVCPEQTGRTLACATCGACWSTLKNVAFIEH